MTMMQHSSKAFTSSRDRNQLKDVTVLREFGRAEMRFNAESINTVEFLITSHALFTQRQIEQWLVMKLFRVIALKYRTITVTDMYCQPKKLNILQSPILSRY